MAPSFSFSLPLPENRQANLGVWGGKRIIYLRVEEVGNPEEVVTECPSALWFMLPA